MRPKGAEALYEKQLNNTADGIVTAQKFTGLLRQADVDFAVAATRKFAH